MAYRQLIVPPCPLKDTPYPVRIELARSIDTVNDNNGYGWMQLAHYLGCSAPYIHSIEARAVYDRQHNNSPTMVLFSDLQNKSDPLFTMRHIERALLDLNLEAVSILYKHLQEIERACHVSIAGSHSLDTNTEPSVCNCRNCIHSNLNFMPREPPERPSHTPRTCESGVFHHSSESERIQPIRYSHTPRMYELGPFQHPSEPERIPPFRNFPTPRTYQFEQFEHLTLSERIPTSHSTLAPLGIPHPRGGVGMGPFTAPPYRQSHEPRNVYMMSPSGRQMPGSSQSHDIHSETLNTFSGRSYGSHARDLPYTQNIPGNDENGYTHGQSAYDQDQSFHGKRTMQQKLNSQDVLISPDDNCQVSDEEGVCTCAISSSELHYSNLPGNNEGRQQTSQQSEYTCCLLSDETCVKLSYDQEAVDYSQCTCHLPTDIQTNELGINRRNSHSDPNLENLIKNENHGVDNKRNSMDETKTDSFCNGKENGNCNRSMNPSQHVPGFSVFVTYSRHNREHVKEVIELCVKLKGYGIRVRVDLSGDQAQDLFKNKHDWLDENLKRARFVIVCISPTYSEDTDRPNSDTEPIPDVSRLDVRFIFDHLRTEYHRNCSQNTRVIPVIFENSGAKRKHLPPFMSTTIVYNYPRQVDSIVEFLQSSSPGKLDLSK
ncbi:hypothetical protein CHS0354_020127 [Potamilus streckersoni]|uniref:SEFIR domain-containing protein n=1 Tax=Potamilus streckersoni TaxID=2493646 RepID=A0AAE0S4W2_9BIVA|nr:hypothetical protein CHS0354_020127 [Potamilus streckersoni]